MQPTAVVRETIARWQEQLLQLDRRNNLLYFKPGTRAVGIAATDVDVFVERLTGARNGLRFAWAEPRATGSQRPRGAAIATVPQAYVLPGDIETDCPPVDLQRRLKKLQKTDKEWLEEQGVNVLFLGVGLLTWVDVDGEVARSPLLLVPCDLSQPSPRDHFSLVREADDATINTTLRYKLEKESGVTLPELEDPESAPSRYLAAVEELVRRRDGWSVSREIVLATFQFSKLAMWEDLGRLKDEEMIEPLVCSLAGDRDARAPQSGPTGAVYEKSVKDLAGGLIDDAIAPGDQLLALPADYSQVLAVEQALSGQHLVIHGPPGTGKSQTIANVIGALLARGKSVLFVSEKTAALDVVKRRLEASDLGAFCLDLHSERGRKANVYQQLRESLDDPRQMTRDDFNYSRLRDRRAELNGFVRALHRPREPLGITLYQGHGQFASLRAAPHVELEVIDAEHLTQHRREQLRSFAVVIAERRAEFRGHLVSRWLALRPSSSTVTLANSVRADMATVVAAAEALAGLGRNVAGVIGTEVPADELAVLRLIDLLRHLESNAGPVPAVWLDSNVLPRVRRLSELEQEAHLRRSGLLNQLAPHFGDQLPNLDFDTLKSNVTQVQARSADIRNLLGDRWEGRVLETEPLLTTISGLPDAIEQARSSIAELAASLGRPDPVTRSEARNVLALGAWVTSLAPVPASWTTASSTEASGDLLSDGRTAEANLANHEAVLLAAFSEDFIAAVDPQMLVRYRTDHRSFLRRLGNQFKRDQRTIAGWKRTSGRLDLDEAASAIEQALEVRSEREHWERLSATLRAEFGHRFRNRGTSWDDVETDRLATASLLASEPLNSALPPALLDASAKLHGLRRAATEKFGKLGSLEDWLLGRPGQIDAPMDSTLAPSRAAAGLITQLAKVLAAVRPRLKREVNSLGELAEILDAAVHVTSIERDADSRRAAFSADLGARFQGFETDWEHLLVAISWTEKLLALAPGIAQGGLLAHAVQPLATERYLTERRRCEVACSEFARRLTSVEQHFDPTASPWGSWSRAPFDGLAEWAQDLSAHADDATSWLAYREAVGEFDQAMGAGAVAHIRAVTDKAEDVPGIVDRRVLGCWLETVYAREPALRTFATEGHNRLLEEFADLDRKSTAAGRDEIRRRVFRRYPDRYATNAAAGEVATLRGQLSRKRNLMPVRRLFRQIPNLVQALKPCFMMSPLAVSQYLPRSPLASETLSFDAVIFDEASQVFPEDAIPAIARAKQVIVVGDAKQLPPTSFFRRAADDEEEEWGDDDDTLPDVEVNALKGRDSVLDALVGLIGAGVGDRYLKVHYRSKHENLIRYSNHEFYDDQLHVFPSPDLSNDGVGLRDVYLPDGRFDSGATKTKTNRVEAEKAVEIVFELMRTCPDDESIGVVTLSRPQADLVSALIDARRAAASDLDQRFASAREEPFFVKNLENVQGDERDHIILSIGYGPTVATGKPFNRFGPINAEGGGRRLNVAVTRARRSMTLVHSLRAEDIVSQQAGSQLLKRYLEFVRDPAAAILSRQTVDPQAVTDSPFEEAVLRALVARGHRVQPQVGVAGYRIDLAIYSLDHTRFDLAIECDGYTYHSSPAARDRDWLRQEILENLGWTFHRVWSTAWARNPESELDAIESALRRARSGAVLRAPVTPLQAPPSAPGDPIVPEPKVPSGAQLLFEPYRQASLQGLRRVGRLSEESDRTLHPMLLRIAEIEGPVHFETALELIRQHYQMSRAGEVSRDRIRDSLARLGRTGALVVTRNGEDTFFALPDAVAVPRRPSAEGFRRVVGHIATSELDTGLLLVVRGIFSVSRDDLVREAARQFGYDRVGSDIAAALTDCVDRMLVDQRLTESFGRLAAP